MEYELWIYWKLHTQPKTRCSIWYDICVNEFATYSTGSVSRTILFNLLVNGFNLELKNNKIIKYIDDSALSAIQSVDDDRYKENHMSSLCSYLHFIWTVKNHWEAEWWSQILWEPSPFLQWDAGGCHTPRQMLCRLITKFATSVSKCFYFLYLWNISRRIRWCGVTKSSLICYIYQWNLLM